MHLASRPLISARVAQGPAVRPASQYLGDPRTCLPRQARQVCDANINDGMTGTTGPRVLTYRPIRGQNQNHAMLPDPEAPAPAL